MVSCSSAKEADLDQDKLTKSLELLAAEPAISPLSILMLMRSLGQVRLDGCWLCLLSDPIVPYHVSYRRTMEIRKGVDGERPDERGGENRRTGDEDFVRTSLCRKGVLGKYWGGVSRALSGDATVL